MVFSVALMEAPLRNGIIPLFISLSLSLSLPPSPVQCHLMGSDICSRECGISVAIALADMHDCGLKRDVKRFKGDRGVHILGKQTCLGVPRSPFSIFMCVVSFFIAPIYIFYQWKSLQKIDLVGMFLLVGLCRERFRKTSRIGNPIDVDRIGFEAWKNMPMEVKKKKIVRKFALGLLIR